MLAQWRKRERRQSGGFSHTSSSANRGEEEWSEVSMAQLWTLRGELLNFAYKMLIRDIHDTLYTSRFGLGKGS